VPVGTALRVLGGCAEERGRDAAGIAVLDRGGNTWSVRKTLGPFRHLNRAHRELDRLLRGALIAIGHTRWATQGGRGLAQASPISVGSLLGTHNGDLDQATIPGHAPCRSDLPVGAGRETWTDSDRLFAVIAAAHARRRGLTDQLVTLLSSVHGRAALAWTDTNRHDHRIWLARGGLSPLAVGVDSHGGLWWASNPAWLRDLGDVVHVGIHITLLAEGSLRSDVPRQHHVSCVPLAEFKPTVRHRDEAIARTAMWRGSCPADRVDDTTLLRHRTIA